MVTNQIPLSENVGDLLNKAEQVAEDIEDALGGHFMVLSWCWRRGEVPLEYHPVTGIPSIPQPHLQGEFTMFICRCFLAVAAPLAHGQNRSCHEVAW